jgi:hypothetical protein
MDLTQVAPNGVISVAWQEISCGKSLPILDEGVRQRLTARFGAEIASWLDELPGVLGALEELWQVEWGSLIARGSMSVVIRCAVLAVDENLGILRSGAVTRRAPADEAPRPMRESRRAAA